MAPRRFLTERLYKELLNSARASSTAVTAAPAALGFPWACASPVEALTPLKPLFHGSSEVGVESEHISDVGSEALSSVSALAVNPEVAGRPDIGVLSELQRLRRENSALAAENAVLRRSPLESSAAVRGAQSQAFPSSPLR